MKKTIVILSLLTSLMCVQRDSIFIYIGFPFQWLIINHTTDFGWYEFYRFVALDYGLLALNFLICYKILKLAVKLTLKLVKKIKPNE